MTRKFCDICGEPQVHVPDISHAMPERAWDDYENKLSTELSQRRVPMIKLGFEAVMLEESVGRRNMRVADLCGPCIVALLHELIATVPVLVKEAAPAGDR